jgi:nucleoside-diphosphate-sugar epimerase
MSELHVVLGTGPLGRSVMEALLRRGRTIWAVNRSGKMAEVPGGVTVARGDVNDGASIAALTRGAAAVYMAAQPEYHEWPEKFPPMMAAVLDGVAASGAKLVIGENLYMYGDTDGRPMAEELPYAATTRKGKARGQVAQMALDAHRAGKVRVTIGRGSDFFGPWVLGSLFGDRFFYPALAGKAANLTGNVDVPHTTTYIGDFGEALAILGERDEALGRAWHVPNDCPQVTQRQFAEMVFAELGQPVKISVMGKTMMRLGGLFVPAARETVEMMYEFEKPFVADSGAFERAFGMRPTPLAESIRATVAWFRAHPQAGAH